MSQRQSTLITQLLDDINGGASGAFAQLVEAVYADLKRIAGAEMRRQFHQPADCLTRCRTEIAHDAIMKLREQYSQWKNREQFFAIATRFIRQLVTDYKRHRLAEMRGHGQRGIAVDRLTFEPAARAMPNGPPGAAPSGDALGSLDRLHECYPRPAEVASLHIVCEFPLPKVAEMIGVSLRTAERDWQLARAFLRRELSG
jgi:RNA polymerase sigma factor (TIGR02999 family)